MLKKKRQANINFQKAHIERMLRKSWKNTDIDIDSLCDEALEQIDGNLSLSENITYCRQKGYFHQSDEEVEKEYKREYEPKLENLKSDLLKSFSPVYRCFRCETIFESRPKLVEHFFKEHGPVKVFPPKEPYSFDYIILKALVDRFVAVNKKYPRAKYFMITCAELYNILLNSLGFKEGDQYAPSNQTPTHVLKRLGLLIKGKREKNRIGWNEKGNRVYHININDLERVVFESEFDDLKLILGQIDTNVINRVAVKPLRPSSDDYDAKDLSTGVTGEFDIDLDF